MAKALFEEFKLYETLWDSLTEAKADTQKLVDFAGEELANRFLAVKSKLKSPENDLYYWIKNKTAEELEQTVSSLENTRSATKTKKDIADKGAELVCETEDWKVYHITTFEASQQYGRDTKWCITGVDNSGDKYWNDYSSQGVQFYFLITKGLYNSRGRDSKFAIAIYPDRDEYEIYDQQDEQVMPYKILNFENINIPGVDFESLEYAGDPDGLYPDYCALCNRLYPARQLRIIDKTNPVPEDPEWDPSIEADLDNVICVCNNCYEKIVQKYSRELNETSHLTKLSMPTPEEYFKNITQSKEEAIKFIKEKLAPQTKIKPNGYFDVSSSYAKVLAKETSGSHIEIGKNSNYNYKAFTKESSKFGLFASNILHYIKTGELFISTPI